MRFLLRISITISFLRRPVVRAAMVLLLFHAYGQGVEAGALDGVKRVTCVSLIAGMSCTGVGCSIGLNSHQPVTAADQRMLDSVISAPKFQLEKPVVVYFLSQIHAKLGVRSVQYSFLGDERWKKILEQDSGASETVVSQLGILRFLQANRDKYVFSEGHTEALYPSTLITLHDLIKSTASTGFVVKGIDSDSLQFLAYYRELEESFQIIPETYDELSGSQKSLLYFGGAEIAWYLGFSPMILPLETKDLNKKAIDGVLRSGFSSWITSGGSNSWQIFDAREIVAYIFLTSQLKVLDADEAVLIFGAGHRLEDYRVPNLRVIRLETRRVYY